MVGHWAVSLGLPMVERSVVPMAAMLVRMLAAMMVDHWVGWLDVQPVVTTGEWMADLSAAKLGKTSVGKSVSMKVVTMAAS